MSHRSRGAWIEMLKFPFFHHTRKCRIAHAVRGLKLYSSKAPEPPISRIAHAVRGLNETERVGLCRFNSRIAHAVRGLKLHFHFTKNADKMSHRSRGAWIEIGKPGAPQKMHVRRIAHAVRGLK